MKRACTYCCVSSLMWVREREHTLIIDIPTQRSWTLRDVEALIWDLMTLDYAYTHIIRLVAYFLDVPKTTAAHRTQEILQLWQTSGLLEATKTSEPWQM